MRKYSGNELRLFLIAVDSYVSKPEKLVIVGGAAIALVGAVNYGTVDIQTAANARELSFEQVPNPEKIVQILNELIMEEERERMQGRAE